MGTSRYKFFETVWNNDLQHNQKGQMTQSIKNLLLTADYVLYSIPLSEKYRPDITAQKFYGNAKYFWILVYINDIKDSPQGFEVNRKIKVPDPAVIGTLI